MSVGSYYLTLNEAEDGEMMEEVKEKTDSEVFKCVPNCGKCCLGSVTVSPIDILEWIRRKRKDILDKLKIVFTGPDSLFPKSMHLGFPQSPHEPCKFLDREKKCSIYPVRPLMCRLVPFVFDIGENGEMIVKPNIKACPHVEGKMPPEPKEWYFITNQLAIQLTVYSSTFYKVFARMLEDKESGDFEAFLSEFIEATEDEERYSR